METLTKGFGVRSIPAVAPDAEGLTVFIPDLPASQLRNRDGWGGSERVACARSLAPAALSRTSWSWMRRGDLEPTPYPEGIEQNGPLLRRTRAITPARCPMLPHSNNESAPR